MGAWVKVGIFLFVADGSAGSIHTWADLLYTRENEAADHTISNCFPMV